MFICQASIYLLQWIDYGLLGISLLVLGYGLYWCSICRHPELEHEETSQFCYQFCINSKYYIAKRWPWNRLKNDLDFLLVSLFATNAGLGRVFKSVQIANNISEELSAHLESLDTYDSMKNPKRSMQLATYILCNVNYLVDCSGTTTSVVSYALHYGHAHCYIAIDICF